MDYTKSLPHLLTEQHMADVWADVLKYPANDTVLHPNAHRLAFADPEFLLRRETRGMRMQLEMLKPDLGQSAQGIHHTVVVFGSARFLSLKKPRPSCKKPNKAMTREPSPWHNAKCEMPSTTTRHACLPNWWLSTAPNNPRSTNFSFVPAAAQASWKQPTVARTRWAHRLSA